MKRFLFAALAIFLGVGMSHAQSLSTDEIVELYGQADQAWGAEVSPDGKYVAIGCAPLGPPSVCIYEISGSAPPQLFQVPDKPRLTTFYWISPKHVLIEVNIFDTISTSSGLKDYRFNRIVSYNVETKESAILMRREARGTTAGDWIVASLPDDDDKILMMLGYEASVWSVDLNSGSARHKETYNSGLFDSLFMLPDGTEAAYTNWNRDSGKFTLRDGRKNVILETVNVDNRPYSIFGFNQDRTALLAWADTPTEFGLKQISLDDGTVSAVEIDGRAVGAVSRIVDEITHELIGVGYTNDLSHQLFIEPMLRSWHDELQNVFPDQNVRITSWSRDKSVMTISVQSEGLPAEYYLFETAGPAVSPLVQGFPQLAGRELGTVEKITYEVSDGLEIDGYMTLPPGASKEDGSLPLILLPHGGPEARDTAGFDWLAQAYAAAGYAVIQPNFRGSSGYGQDFRNAGYGEFGGKMITDILAAADWATEEGIAREGGYCIVGGSYGGYAALQGSVLGGSDVKCAVSINGVSHPTELVGAYSDNSGAFYYWRDYMGVSRFSSENEKHEITPRDRVDEIEAAVLLLHGKEDTTVDVSQSRSMANIMEGRSDFRFVEMDGEDHYLGSAAARQTVLRESLHFLETYFPVK